MADSLRQDIMDVLGASLETISTANGYETNVGLKTYEWRAYAFDDSQLPILTYRDTDDIIVVTHNYAMHQLRVEMFFAAAGDTSPNRARDVIADINSMIVSQKDAGKDTYFDELVLDIVPIESPLDAEQADKKLLGCTVAYNFFFLTPKLSSFLT